MIIEKGNILIAEFMGYTYGKVSGWVHGSRKGVYKKDEQNNLIEFHLEEQIKYHLSWSWLMPVVEKIESIGFCTRFDFNIDNGQTIYFWDHPDDNAIIHYNEISLDKITAVWNSIIKFIQWYNQNKK